jgi:hypothetical protein
MIFSLDLISGVLSFLFTILILSYLIGDNPLFRIAIYLFVGITAGYVAALVLWQVLVPRLFMPTLSILQTSAFDQAIFLVVPWLGVGFILMKISPRLSKIASLTMAFLVGAGAAVIIAGALFGTIIPQVSATINFFDARLAVARNIQLEEILFSGTTVLVGVVSSLAYFHFGARPQANGSMRRVVWINVLAWIGQIAIGITLGVTFAGVYAAALTAFIERISSLINFFGIF